MTEKANMANKLVITSTEMLQSMKAGVKPNRAEISMVSNAVLDGANYVHGLLTGYKDAPAGKKIPEVMNYNAYFAGNLIAMPPPLSDEGVDYSDKTKATVAQQAEDVVTFLSWAAEPELEERKRMGVKVILFLLLLTGLLYVVKRRIWAGVH